MTFIGKLFVMLNLALSLMLGTIAFAVYAGGIDFSDNPAKGSQPPGKLFAKKADLEELLNKQLPIVDASWRQAHAALLASEDIRRVDQTAYVAELQKLVTGNAEVKMVDPKKPIETRPLDQLLVNAEEAMNVPLLPLPVYNDRLQMHRKDSIEIRVKLEAALKEDTVLTNQLIGDPERKTRGLRQMLALERKKKEGIIDEQGILEGLRINVAVDSELVIKRLESLDERIGELVRYLKKRHNVDVPAKWR